MKYVEKRQSTDLYIANQEDITKIRRLTSAELWTTSNYEVVLLGCLSS